MKYAILAMTALAVAPIWAQDAQPERVTVPLSDPARPVTVRANLVHGSIAVRAHEAGNVIVEARSKGARRQREAPEGMRRIDVINSGLTVEEENNVVRIGAGPVAHVELVVLVPARTSVNLKTVNGRGITVEGISGEVDAEAVNGSVTITNVSGAVVAHSLNGKLLVTLDRITAGKPMSFSTLNGDIDVTFPPDLKANVKMKSQNGEILTDFDVAVRPERGEAANERSDGKFRVRFDRAFLGTINGGGPEFQFTTMNGRIFLRKRK